jgi:hypothetical protein
VQVQVENIDTRSDYEIWLGDQLKSAKFARQRWEEEWGKNEMSLYDNGDSTATIQSTGSQSGSTDAAPEARNDAALNFMALNLNARNAGLIQSQLISNVPAMMAIPANDKDRTDREAAQAHERALMFLKEEKNWGGWIGLSLMTLVTYGTCTIKQIMKDSAGGYDYDSEGKITPIGDITYSVPSVWDIWFDPNATSALTVNKVWERLHFDYESAKSYFGEEASRMLCNYAPGEQRILLEGSQLPVYFTGTVEVYECWITGCAADNFKGKLIYHTSDGRILKIQDNPCKFNMFPKAKSTKKIRAARLPYNILTYEDIPGSSYGRSPAAKCYRAQAVLNQCAAVVLQTAKNMGTPKVMTTTAVVNRGTLTDDNVQVIEIDPSGGDMGGGGSFPAVFQAANTSNDIKVIIEEMKTHINDQWGINDALLGKQGRETQGVTMQVSIQQGNLVREWLFDKYVKYLKDIAALSLAYAVDYWTEDKWKLVLGKEDSASLLKSAMQADVESGYTIHLERNMLIALDPISRQEQLLRLKDVFSEAGLDKRYYVRLFRLADFRGIYSQFDYADNRGKRQIDYVIKEKKLPTIYKHEDHIGIAAYVTKFINSFEFEELKDEEKILLDQLVDKHLEIESQKMAGNAQSGLPSAAGQTAVPPM